MNLRHNKTGKLFSIITSLMVVVLIALVTPQCLTASGGPAFKWGFIAGKGLVLSEAGKPIWVEYTADGEVRVPDELGEAVGDLEDAIVMPAHTFRTHAAEFTALKESYAGQSDAYRVLTRDEYLEEKFHLADGAVYANKPALKRQDTYSVVVRTAPYLYSQGMDLVLLEAPINLGRPESMPEAPVDVSPDFFIDPDAVTLLLQKEGRRVLYQSPHNIGYKAAFYSKGGDWEDNSGQMGLYGYDRLEDTLWAPLQGAKVYSTLFAEGLDLSHADGRFVLNYIIPPCPGFSYIYDHNVVGELSFLTFNPKSKRPFLSYFVSRPVSDLCTGYSDGYYPQILQGVSTKMAVQDIELGTMGNKASMDARMPVKLTVDLAMLTGQAVLKNEMREGVTGYGRAPEYLPLAEKTIYDDATASFWKHVDYDGDGNEDIIRYSRDYNDNGERVWYMSVWQNGNYAGAAEPDLYQELGQMPDLSGTFQSGASDFGLLSAISGKDLEDTDTFVFRESNGMLITYREGLKPAETPYVGTITSDTQALVNYRIKMRGPIPTAPHAESIADWGAKSNLNADLCRRNADHLRPGEMVKVVMVNRPTGYIGTQTVQVGFHSGGAGLVNFTPPVIEMRPPNLKIRAERTYMVEAGLDQGEKEYLIGFEGSGLNSDDIIRISTEWVDWDGSPLPEGLKGYTGRIAKIVAPNMLEDAGNPWLAQFEIRPGTHTQVVKLPKGDNPDTQKAHYYIQVNGEPVERNPSFSSAADFQSLGAGDGLLQYRPAHYVPVQVPVYDAATTQAAEAARRKLISEGADPASLPPVEATYDWVYRPEMQFSLHSLSMGDDLMLDSEALAAITTSQYDLPTLLSSLTSTYALFMEELPMLDEYGFGREFVIGLNDLAVTATLGADGSFRFDDVDAVRNLEPEDLMTLQLFQAGDDANILWQYSFPELVRTQGIFTSHTDDSSATIEVSRSYQASRFEPPVDQVDYLDGFRIIPFYLENEAHVSVKLVDDEGEEKGTLVPERLMSPGNYRFVVDYDSLSSAGLLPGQRFEAVLVATPADRGHTRKVRFKGRMVMRREGHVLGQIMVHNVLLQDGSLNLSRRDFELKGRGPDLAFSRSYNNQAKAHGFTPLGPGWVHSYDKKVFCRLAGRDVTLPLPKWVSDLKGHFFTPDRIPDSDTGWDHINVNGTSFRKVEDMWHAERGRHGKLDITDATITYTAKDGTRYIYENPAYPWLRTAGDDEEHFKLVPSHGTGQLRSIKDRNGNTMSFKYNGLGHLEKVTDAVGREMTLTYANISCGIWGMERRLTQVSASGGITVTYEYDENGFLKKAIRADRSETYAYEKKLPRSFEYNLTKTTDSNNQSYGYAYFGRGAFDSLINVNGILDSYEAVESVTYPDGADAGFQYDKTNNKRTVVDLRGNPTTYKLSFYGNPIEIQEPLGKLTKMTWSITQGLPDNVMTSRTDGNGVKTTYEHDENGNVTKETDVYGYSVTTTWNGFSQPLTRVDKNGKAQKWEYDGKGNLIAYTDGELKSTAYAYNEFGERVSMTAPQGQNATAPVTHYAYDALGNPETVTLPEGSQTHYDYDTRGRLVAVTDPRGFKTVTTYDELDYKQSVTLPENAFADGATNTLAYDYDAEGNLLSENDCNGLTLAYTYSPRYQVETVTRGIGGVKSYLYDENGNLTSETDWKGAATTHGYNALNQRTSSTNRLGISMSMDYDPEGNLLATEDYAGTRTTHLYDKLNRCTSTALHGEDGGEVTYAYYNGADPDTNLKTVTDQNQEKTTFEYNGRYQKTRRINALTDTFEWRYDARGNLIETIDEEKNKIAFQYDRQDRKVADIAYLDGREVRTAYAYDAAGNIAAVTNARGKTTTHAYDPWNRLEKITDPDGFIVRKRYDGEGNLTSETDGNLITRTWKRDLQGLVEEATDGEGEVTRFTYDANGNLLTTTNPKGTVVTQAYDAEDLPETITQEGFLEEDGTRLVRSRDILERDGMGNILREEDFRGNVTKTRYNALYLPVEITDPAGKVTVTAYYPTGRVKSVTDRRGKTESRVYDALGRLTLVTDPLSQTVDTTYDRVGNVKTITDKRGILTENFYDDLYRVVRVERAGLTTATREYDDLGNLTAETDAEGVRVEHSYNDRGLLHVTTHTDNSRKVTEIRHYDGAGNLISHENELGKITATTYDGENRKKTVTFGGETTVFNYDAHGNLTATVKPLGNKKEMAYDGFDRLKEVSEGGLVTSYTYDEGNNLRHTHAPGSVHTENTWDNLNRKTAHVHHKSSGNLTVSYTNYDDEGNLLEMVDAKDQVFTYAYDDLGRQTDSWSPETGASFLEITHIHTDYDGNNNVTQITETKTGGAGPLTDITENTYDDFDRLEQSVQRGATVSHTYYDNGNRKTVTTDAGTTTYTYDDRNRLKTATVGADVTTWTYRDDNLKKSIAYPNNTETTYTYNETTCRLEGIEHRNTGTDTLISSYAYTHDANGNRKSQVEVQNGVTETTTYNYDGMDRLIDFNVTGSTSTQTVYTYENFNRKTETVTENSSLRKRRTYTYDETNWLTRITDNTDESAPFTIDYAYDKNGNTVLKTNSSLINQDQTFSYDSRNQLVQITRGPPATPEILGQYDYNASGLRVRHRLSERGDVDYFYDDGAVIEERNASDNSLLAHYRYADRLISLDTGGSIQYYHHDALGSTVNLTNPDGSTRVSYQLDPWGNIRSQSGTSVNRQIFTGQEHDEKTGLVYFGARYYDPDTARFITQDTYLGEQGVPPSLHRYLYAYSNPLSYYDPDGHMALFKNMADGLGRFNGWLRDQTADFQDAGFVGKVGAVATGVTRAFVGTAEGGLRVANYVANRASMGLASALGKEDADWAVAHAQEVNNTHQAVNQTIDYLRNGGIVDLAQSGMATLKAAANGDVVAISDCAEMFGGMLTGGSGAVSSVARTGTRNMMRVAAKTSKRVVVSGARQVAKRAPKITGEIAHSVVSKGRNFVQGVKTAYGKSRLASEVGAVGRDISGEIRRASLNKGLRGDAAGNLDEAIRSAGGYIKTPKSAFRSSPDSYYKYSELRGLIKQSGLSGQGKGFEAHHLLEKRFASRLGVAKDDIISVPLTPTWHRNVGGMGKNIDAAINAQLKNMGTTPSKASLDQIWNAHKNVYNKLGQSDWANAVYEAYFKGQGVTI